MEFLYNYEVEFYPEYPLSKTALTKLKRLQEDGMWNAIKNFHILYEQYRINPALIINRLERFLRDLIEPENYDNNVRMSDMDLCQIDVVTILRSHDVSNDIKEEVLIRWEELCKKHGYESEVDTYLKPFSKISDLFFKHYL